MSPSDAQLIAGFLIRDFQSWAEYLDSRGIDPTEASVIIEGILSECGSKMPSVTCRARFSGDGIGGDYRDGYQPVKRGNQPYHTIFKSEGVTAYGNLDISNPPGGVNNDETESR